MPALVEKHKHALCGLSILHLAESNLGQCQFSWEASPDRWNVRPFVPVWPHHVSPRHRHVFCVCVVPQDVSSTDGGRGLRIGEDGSNGNCVRLLPDSKQSDRSINV